MEESICVILSQQCFLVSLKYFLHLLGAFYACSTLLQLLAYNFEFSDLILRNIVAKPKFWKFGQI